MSTEENKAKQLIIFEEIINKGNLALVDELVDPEYVYHGPMGMEFKGPEGLKQLCIMFSKIFPDDMHTTIDDIFAVGDKTVVRYTGRGTHKGEFMGIAPTGKQTAVMGILIVRWVNGKEAEAWELVDLAGLMQQLGAIPPMGQGGK
ncbi:MAG: ester cyclase [Dehalococcoidales bacterium]|nr:ester cyclase [Dehalococcoidales bacterium]